MKSTILDSMMIRRAFARTRRPGWLIASYPRCGTHMLASALDSHSELRCYGEVCNPAIPAGQHGLATAEILHAFWLTRRHGFIAHAFIGQPGGADGFNLASPAHAGLWDLLPDDTRILSCRRRNLLARFVSHAIANRTQVWRAGPNHKPAGESIRIDAGTFLKDADFVRRCWLRIDERFPNRHVVWYEDLVARWEPTIAGCLRYLGVALEPLSPGCQKIGRPLRASVENFDQLRRELSGRVPNEWFEE